MGLNDYTPRRESEFLVVIVKESKLKIQENATQSSNFIYKTLTILSQGHLNKGNTDCFQHFKRNLFQALSISSVLVFPPTINHVVLEGTTSITTTSLKLLLYCLM